MDNKTVNPKTLALDARPDRLDLRDREYQAPLKDLPDTYPPTNITFRLFKHYAETCELILYQGERGACTGFGLAAVINFLRWKQTVIGSDSITQFNSDSDYPEVCIKTVSERMLYHNARIYDEWDGEDYEGSSCRGAMKGWHRHGVCDSEYWPYRDNDVIKFVDPDPRWTASALETPLGSYYRINKKSIVDMQSAIYEVGAIYCSSYTHSGWFDLHQPNKSVKRKYKDLPFIARALRSDNAGGHAFAIVGYTRDGFIVQNSWGVKWGAGGFALLEYEDWIERGMDAWVVVRGAPTSRTQAPRTVVHRALQDKTARPDDREGLIIESLDDSYGYVNDNLKPWSEEKAYEHSVIIGNSGRAVHKIIDAATPEDCIRKICYEFCSEQMPKMKSKKMVVHVHGCLYDEKSAIRRAQILGPYYYENGIYPIFIVWQSGVAQTLATLIDRSWNAIVTDPGSGAIMKNISKADDENIDRALEVAVKRQGGKSLWSELKKNATNACQNRIPAASGGGAKVKGAMVNVADWISKNKDVEVHVVGHSSGAILIGEWLDVLARRKRKLKTVSLYAPACTAKFANKHYIAAVEKNVFSKSALHVDMLSDERERSCSTGHYGKSLLYLVSRAFVDLHKEPLFGLEATWTRDENGVVYRDQMKIDATDEEVVRFESIEQLLGFWQPGVKLTVHGSDQKSVVSSTNNDSVPLSHGSFLNNISVVEATIKRILGRRKMKFTIEHLGGF